METLRFHENYPFRIVVLSNLVSFLIYFLGFIIIYRSGWIFSVIYLAFILTLEIRLIRMHCIDCYYFGKTCGFGKGKISSLFFKKGSTDNFSKPFSWKNMIPDMMVSLVPLITGIIFLIIKFDIILLLSLLILIILTTAGNSYIRGKLTCACCKQREMGCPAEQLFNKNK